MKYLNLLAVLTLLVIILKTYGTSKVKLISYNLIKWIIILDDMEVLWKTKNLLMLY